MRSLGKAKCSACAVEKPAESFYASQKYVCKGCVKARAKKWYSQNTSRAKANCAAYARANPEKTKLWKNAWDQRNKEQRLAANRAYCARFPERRVASRANWNNKNRERIAKVSAAWQKANRAKCAAYLAAHNAAKLRALPKWANRFFISEAYSLAILRTKMLGYQWHVDHIVPLISKKVCGLHVEHNLKVIPGTLNMSKGNRHWPDMP